MEKEILEDIKKWSQRVSRKAHHYCVRWSAWGGFYGFRVCSDFSQKATAGEVYYGLKPRKFMDVTGEMVQPDRAFKVTAEVLRRKPESALVWYEDFCDYSEIPTNYFTVLDGSWKIWKDESSDRIRKYSQLEGSGKLALDYTGFSEIHVRARFAFKSSGGGKAGVFLGSIFCCINYDTSVWSCIREVRNLAAMHLLSVRPQMQIYGVIQAYIPWK